jgi:hypothetical protein
MSYSRWGNSRWYTYWCVHPTDSVEDIDNAIFKVCGVLQFSAKELRADITGCAKKAADIDGAETLGEIKELEGYMKGFLDDVDANYA